MENIAFENRRLKKQLDSLLLQARNNEAAMQRYQSFELRLLAATSFSELIRLLLDESRSSMGLQAVTLVLTDTNHELRRCLELQGLHLRNYPGLILEDDASSLQRVYGSGLRPRLGGFDSRRHGALFPHLTLHRYSVALLPLVRKGELTGSLNFASTDESRFLGDLGTVFLDHLAVIVAVCLENTLNRERLKRAGLVDPLTGVNNRRFLEERLREEVARAQRYRKPLACLFVDVDYFKRVNDDFNHQTGDTVLAGVARVIKDQLRGSDVLARYGGEEFIAVLPDTAESDALAIAERIRAAVEACRFEAPDGQLFSVTVSVGVAVMLGSSLGNATEAVTDALVGQADRALLEAKRSGRNRVINAGLVAAA